MYSWDEKIKLFKKLGFEQSNNRSWSNYFQLKDEKNNLTYFVLPTDDDDDDNTVVLYIFNHVNDMYNRWDNDSYKQFFIPLDQLPQYVTNYRLNLE